MICRHAQNLVSTKTMMSNFQHCTSIAHPHQTQYRANTKRSVNKWNPQNQFQLQVQNIAFQTLMLFFLNKRTRSPTVQGHSKCPFRKFRTRSVTLYGMTCHTAFCTDVSHVVTATPSAVEKVEWWPNLWEWWLKTYKVTTVQGHSKCPLRKLRTGS